MASIMYFIGMYSSIPDRKVHLWEMIVTNKALFFSRVNIQHLGFQCLPQGSEAYPKGPMSSPPQGSKGYQIQEGLPNGSKDYPQGFFGYPKVMWATQRVQGQTQVSKGYPKGPGTFLLKYFSN